MCSNKNKSKEFCLERTANTPKQAPLLSTSETNIKRSKQSLMESYLVISRSNDWWLLLIKTNKWVRIWNCSRSFRLLFDLILSMNLSLLVMSCRKTANDLLKKLDRSSHLKQSKRLMRISSQSKQRKTTTEFSSTLDGIQSKRSWLMLR